MPSDAERARSLLAYANYAKVAAALLVSRAAVADWAKGKSVTPYRLRQLEQLLRPDLQTQQEAAPLDEERLARMERWLRAIAVASGVPSELVAEIEALDRDVDAEVRVGQRNGARHQTADTPSRDG